eukprot:TRINITY_DN13625_c0_g1_i1.p1 TRINITY_DN13625_c0_g1~~TRINITY_DN13625_c0_g1_i1.p1  ORF type:complete len:1432 (+),score=169.81 TRINITY_DN13625_c0_g1_i1:127-4296(+)
MADFSHVVYQSVSGSSLFTYSSIISMCTLETIHLKNQPQYTELCETKGPADCCPGWSLGGYVALLYNRTSCFTIQESDVEGSLTLLRSCAKYYRDGSLTSDCGSHRSRCRSLPPECTQHNAVYTILHFLTDDKFFGDKESTDSNLTYAMSFLPLARSSAMLNFYGNIEGKQLCDGITEIVAMDFGLKDALFNAYLLEDASYLLFAVLLIFLSVWSFTASLTLTIASLSSIGAALGLAYFTYTFIFNLKFFPFMNVLAVVIALGVGADDTFILSRVWAQKQHDIVLCSPSTTPKLENLVCSTMQHALVSMLVTSVTTTAAFFSSYISSITAIKCFSIFAGLTIIWNFILMVTWVPSWIILHHKLLVLKLSSKLPSFPARIEPVISTLISGTFIIASGITNFFEKILPYIIVKPRLIWITLLGGIVGCSAVALFYFPGLKLPENNELQLFTADHPFEKYDLDFKEKFGFEKSFQREHSINMPLRFVWGSVSQDNGNHLNPGDKGTLLLDPDFEISSKESQSWMFKFCNSLKKQTFYKYTHGDLQLSNCFIITFKEWMYRPCYNDLSKENHRPCCRESVFPFEENVFKECLLLAIDDLYETPSFLWLPGVAGPKFDINTKTVSAAIIEYESTQPFTFNYIKMHEFYSEVETWFQEMMKDAPIQLKNGFFVSYLEFYDLQKSLQEGTFVAIAVAMVISFLVLFLSTQNVMLSVFAITTVFSIIIVTVAVLVVLGWKLNILESVVITLAIGLSVDFTLHYGIMYKLSGETDRDKSVTFSVATMASPVSMAAFTTFCAGICLLPTRVLAYIQIGTFIIVLMTTSWAFSTFFFQSMLRSWGPTNSVNFKLPLPQAICCSVEPDEDEVETIQKAYTVSDTIISHVSSSNISYHIAEPTQLPENGDKEMIPLTVTRSAKQRRRSNSYSKHIDDTNTMPLRKEDHSNGYRRKSFDTILQEMPQLVPPSTMTVATLHSKPSIRSTNSFSYNRSRDVSPSRKSLHEPLFVSDGRTIRCDPYHMSLKRDQKGHKEDNMKRRQTLPSGHLLSKEETNTKTSTNHSVALEADSQALSCPVTRNTTNTLVYSTAPQNQMPSLANGAIPKHSRKKSLPESAYLHRNDSNQQPYEILNSPKIRPRSSAHGDGNSRPHSSISMGDVLNMHDHIDNDSPVWTLNDRDPRLAQQERVFHTLERESANVGRHPHPGELQEMQLAFESTDSIELRLQENMLPGLNEREAVSYSEVIDEENLLHCVTPAPYEFDDNVQEMDIESRSMEKDSIGQCVTPILSERNATPHSELCEPYQVTEGFPEIEKRVNKMKSSKDELTNSEPIEQRSTLRSNRKSLNDRDLERENDTYRKERHAHSRSTETILFHNDKDPNPIVPNKKPGTPDIWLPRTIRA